MTVWRGFVITILSGLLGGSLGAILGYILGRFAPGYYRLMFQIPPTAELNAVQVGIGLGITQGLMAGLVVGLVIVAVVAWYRSRSVVMNPMPKSAASP
jgi:hypothetical protein